MMICEWQVYSTPLYFRYFHSLAGSGSHMGLSVVLYANVDDYHCSTTNSVGFKVLLHPPTETPKIADFGFTVSPGNEVRVVVTPRIANASPLIRKVPYMQRQCFFANEGNLTYYRYRICELFHSICALLYFNKSEQNVFAEKLRNGMRITYIGIGLWLCSLLYAARQQGHDNL